MSEANGALQTRDRCEHRLWNGPGSATHRAALRCARDTNGASCQKHNTSFVDLNQRIDRFFDARGA
jgi:hypothetical protein